MYIRPSKRKHTELREISIEKSVLHNALASCLIKYGKTEILCSASLDGTVPRFLKGKNTGWVTAEYSMIPCSTHSRIKRESAQGKQNGRTLEIQRLISRSLRSVVNLPLLGERQIIIDCDVINADGGTRTASITGSYVALHLAIRRLIERAIIKKNPLIAQVVAVSCGLCHDDILLDLDYEEDSSARVDANFVFNSNGKIVEIQASAEESDFSEEEFLSMLQVAKSSAGSLFAAQNRVLLD